MKRYFAICPSCRGNAFEYAVRPRFQEPIRHSIFVAMGHPRDRFPSCGACKYQFTKNDFKSSTVREVEEPET